MSHFPRPGISESVKDMHDYLSVLLQDMHGEPICIDMPGTPLMINVCPEMYLHAWDIK